MNDLIHNQKVLRALNPVTLSATTNGLVVDTADGAALMFSINVGTFATFTGTDKLTVKVQEGDLADASDMADIAAADYLDSYVGNVVGWDRIMDGATDDEQIFAIGVRMSSKRYRRLVFTEGGTVSVIISAEAHLGRLRHSLAA